MPRSSSSSSSSSRGSEMVQSRRVSQRQRGAPHHPLRTSTSDSDTHTLHNHHRPITDRSPKLGGGGGGGGGDHRSPRGPPLSAFTAQKKLGTRIADLESQLGQAQQELKILKSQLSSAKKEAQRPVNEKKTTQNKPAVLEPEEKKEEEEEEEKVDILQAHVIPPPPPQPEENDRHEADVFQVPVEKRTIDSSSPYPVDDQLQKDNKSVDMTAEPQGEALEGNKATGVPVPDDLASKDEEINMLKAKLGEREKDIEAMANENENLKNQANAAASIISSAKAKEEQLSTNLSQLGRELEESKAKQAQLTEKLEAVQVAKDTLEAEMRKMTVQTDQWRKAADAAAAVLAGGVEMNGRLSERCVSMDKHFGGLFEAVPGGGYTGFAGSPGIADDMEDGFASGRRKGSGIKMFGDLWKRKGQR